MTKMAEICQDPMWILSLAKAADAGSTEGWCGGQRGPPQKAQAMAEDSLKDQASLCWDSLPNRALLLSSTGVNSAQMLQIASQILSQA